MTRQIGCNRTAWVVCSVLWLAAASAGLAWMAGYANRPGPAAEAPTRWPADSHITRDSSRPTLVMLAHPQCDCTRASLAELAELMARAQRRPKAFVVFIHPPGVSGQWEQTALWRAASQISEVTAVRDDDGLEAKRFGSYTSGQTLLYDAAGRLRFSGGTTIGRGHVGENPGVASLLAILDGSNPHRTTTPVFGCSLFAAPQDVIQVKEVAQQ